MLTFLCALWSINWSSVVTLSSALLSPIAVTIATYIAVQQYRLNRRQYRLSLFDKRMAVFNVTMTMIASVITANGATLEQSVKFMRDTKDHEFLFGPEVGNYVGKVYKQSVALDTFLHVDQNDAAKQARQVILQWFSTQLGEARQVFGKYLDFTKLE
jgi:hypothetical protein